MADKYVVYRRLARITAHDASLGQAAMAIESLLGQLDNHKNSDSRWELKDFTVYKLVPMNLDVVTKTVVVIN